MNESFLNGSEVIADNEVGIYFSNIVKDTFFAMEFFNYAWKMIIKGIWT